MTDNIQDIKNVPELRFPEFEGEWRKDKFGNLFQINAGGDIDNSHVSKVKTETYKYPIYANTEKHKGFYAYSNIYKVDENVITVAGRGVYIGIAHARTHKFYPIVRLLVLKPKEQQNIFFFEYQINRINFYNESTGVPQLTAPQLSTYKLFYSGIQEQEKIANFLMQVDKRIENLDKKKEKLEEYKKGVMQKIFSQEIRFKDEDGNDYPSWEEKRLGEISKIVKGKQFNKEELEDVGVYPAINGGIQASGYSDKWNTNENTITISEGGNSCGYVNFIKTKFWSGGHCYAILNIEEQYDSIFLFQTLKYNQTMIMNLRVGSGLPNIQKKDIDSFILVIPCIIEQQKIANFLSSIDAQIEKVSKQIESSKEFKKGLLQKMFV